jgi:hypothetical protein
MHSRNWKVSSAAYTRRLLDLGDVSDQLKVCGLEIVDDDAHKFESPYLEVSQRAVNHWRSGLG